MTPSAVIIAAHYGDVRCCADLPPTTCDYGLGIARRLRNASHACRRKNERRTVADMRAEAAQAPQQSGGFPPNSGVDTQQVGQHMVLGLTLPGRDPPKSHQTKGWGWGFTKQAHAKPTPTCQPEPEQACGHDVTRQGESTVLTMLL